MAIKTFPRATEPHRPALAATLVTLIGGHVQRYDAGTLTIEADFGAVTDGQVQALVDAAPQATPALDLQAQVDALSPLLEAIVWTLVDAINLERLQHGRQTITKAMFRTAVKAKVDEAP